jgi:phosphoserine aminotransferase
VYSGASTNFKRIPKWSEMKFNKDSIYCHITTNNTIYGTQYRDMGNLEQGKLAADMSSDFMTRDFDINKFFFIYAGAQKHLGPSGVTVVIIRKDMAEKGAKNIPTILQYRTHIENDSLYNTPPAFAIYVVMLMTEWMKRLGGVAAIEKQVTGRAKKVYDILDRSQVYTPNVEKESRSMTNITFRLKSEELEKKFADDAKKEGLVGLKGHRSAGGIRVSNYIAMTEQGIDKLVDFMKKFEKKS